MEAYNNYYSEQGLNPVNYMTEERAKCYFQNLEVKCKLSQDEEQCFPRKKEEKNP